MEQYLDGDQCVYMHVCVRLSITHIKQDPPTLDVFALIAYMNSSKLMASSSERRYSAITHTSSNVIDPSILASRLYNTSALRSSSSFSNIDAIYNEGGIPHMTTSNTYISRTYIFAQIAGFTFIRLYLPYFKSRSMQFQKIPVTIAYEKRV